MFTCLENDISWRQQKRNIYCAAMSKFRFGVSTSDPFRNYASLFFPLQRGVFSRWPLKTTLLRVHKNDQILARQRRKRIFQQFRWNFKLTLASGLEAPTARAKTWRFIAVRKKRDSAKCNIAANYPYQVPISRWRPVSSAGNRAPPW